MTQKLYLTFLVICMFSCRDTLKIPKDNIVQRFIESPKDMMYEPMMSPIDTFVAVADKLADKRVVFRKSKADSLMQLTKEYSHAVIVVETHTIVKLEKLDSCQQSGAWKTCMPLGVGYIKKKSDKHRKMRFQKGNIQYIIGTPDSQTRIMYFFR
ncbi:MAG: hypothetical protein OIF50_11040 [Flavobacteriaceae bacterium]|nr:hypothetical protein [Flavobacteriaceae bacterium]